MTIMDYRKITIGILPYEEWLRDVLIAQMAEIGFDSFVDLNNGMEAYIPADSYEKEKLNEILLNFSDDFKFELKSELIADRNWNEEWEKNYFKPLVVANECVIRAPFHQEFPKLKYEIVIEPNMAFGTGNHETTSLMLEFILKTDMVNKRVLDMGCGTGILGILASMKGAKSVTAIDIDKWSYGGTVENAEINNIQNIDVKLGDASMLGREKYDIIFANIQRNVLLNDMPTYNKVLHEGGTIIMSGFYKKNLQAIKEKAESLGLKEAGFLEKNNWVAAIYIKS